MGDTRTGTDGWFARLTSHDALFAVDLDQRVTRWSSTCDALLGPAEQALGRHCYEVLASLDPRNGRRCRPNCAVIAAARAGRPTPDFEVWAPDDDRRSRRAVVSILLHRGEADDGDCGTEVVHLVRSEDAAPPHDESVCALPVLSDAPVPPADCAELSARQREVLRRLAAGEPPQEIAVALGIRPVTVRNHIQAAMDRLGARTRLEAVLAAARAGLI